MKSSERIAKRLECLNALTAHDRTSPFVTPEMMADALMWLRDEVVKVAVPDKRRDYEPISRLTRIFQVTQYRAKQVISKSRIGYNITSSGKRVYSVKDFELALKANNQ